jgi:hypothetical protein
MQEKESEREKLWIIVPGNREEFVAKREPMLRIQVAKVMI